MGLDFQIKARAGFLAFARVTPRFRIIPGEGDPDQVAETVLAATLPMLDV
jgi:hypothetical protein